jgi:glycosyltransferase involved in cell wall biosynthesis
VIVPAYNRWPLVREAVDSALGQELGDLETIVVDDGSTDGTAERLDGLDPRLRVVRQPNRERGAARNRGIAEARGRFLVFLDSDDVLEPWQLRQFSDALGGHREAQAFAAAARFWDPESGKLRPLPRIPDAVPDLRRAALRGMALPLQGLVVASEAARQVGGFPEARESAGSEDYVFQARLVHRFDVVRLPRPGARIRVHRGRSMNDAAARIASARAAYDTLLREGLDDSGPLDAAARREIIVGADGFQAAHAYALGEMRAARSLLREVRRNTGLRPWLRSSGRLWCQTWLGARGSRLARALRERVR